MLNPRQQIVYSVVSTIMLHLTTYTSQQHRYQLATHRRYAHSSNTNSKTYCLLIPTNAFSSSYQKYVGQCIIHICISLYRASHTITTYTSSSMRYDTLDSNPQRTNLSNSSFHSQCHLKHFLSGRNQPCMRTSENLNMCVHGDLTFQCI